LKSNQLSNVGILFILLCYLYSLQHVNIRSKEQYFRSATTYRRWARFTTLAHDSLATVVERFC